jgi:hypothetical protein
MHTSLSLSRIINDRKSYLKWLVTLCLPSVIAQTSGRPLETAADATTYSPHPFHVLPVISSPLFPFLFKE